MDVVIIDIRSFWMDDRFLDSRSKLLFLGEWNR